MAATGWNANAPVALEPVALELDEENSVSAQSSNGQWNGPVLDISADADADARQLERFAKIRAMLDDEVFRVDFFQAVRLLERIEKDRKPVGYFMPPGSEAIRFSSHTTLAFPPSQLYHLERGEDGQLRLVVQFMGLCSSVTIMPAVYSEYLLLQLKNKDTAMRDFFDIFNHRMVSLFYRGWEKYRFFIGYEADRDTGGHAGIKPRLMDLLGLGTRGLQERSVLPDAALIAYSGLLGRHTRSAGALKQILEDYFDVPITIEQFTGTWRALPRENQTTFEGKNRASERLGVGTVVGNEVWDNHGRIRICIGPVGFDQYVSFLPGPGAYAELEAWVRFYSSGQYEAEVRLILKRQEAPACELGATGTERPRLGLASWLKTKPLHTDPGDAIFLLT